MVEESRIHQFLYFDGEDVEGVVEACESFSNNLSVMDWFVEEVSIDLLA